jgi:hypothetical protein
VTLRAILPSPIVCGVALLLGGCGPLGLGPGTTGELGNGIFTYACSSDSDPICDDALGFHEMPKAVAVGSRFGALFKPSGSSGNTGSAQVRPASRELLIETEDLDSSFKAVAPGTAGLLAYRGSTVVDFIHVRLANIAHIQIDKLTDEFNLNRNGITSIDIDVDDDVTVRAAGVDESDELLAGALSCSWKSDDSAIAEIVTLPSDNRIRVIGRAIGETKLRVEISELTAELTVKVTGKPAGAGGAGGAGGQGGAGGMGGAGGSQ